MSLQINERAIQPINTWVQGAQKVLSVFRIDNFQNYYFDGGSGQVHWVMFSIDPVPAIPATPATDNTPATEEILATTVQTPRVDGLVSIPVEVLSLWGSDDNIIFNYVMSQLNIQEVTS